MTTIRHNTIYAYVYRQQSVYSFVQALVSSRRTTCLHFVSKPNVLSAQLIVSRNSTLNAQSVVARDYMGMIINQVAHTTN